MGALVAVLLLWWRFKRQLDALVPRWLLQAGQSLLHGKTPQLTSAHLAALASGGMAALVVFFCLAFFVMQISRRMGTTSIDDPRLVDEKTARPAYRVRLRLFVFSAQARTLPALATQCQPRHLQRLHPPVAHPLISGGALPGVAGNATATTARPASARRRA